MNKTSKACIPCSSSLVCATNRGYIYFTKYTDGTVSMRMSTPEALKGTMLGTSPPECPRVAAWLGLIGSET